MVNHKKSSRSSNTHNHQGYEDGNEDEGQKIPVKVMMITFMIMMSTMIMMIMMIMMINDHDHIEDKGQLISVKEEKKIMIMTAIMMIMMMNH